MSKSYKSLFLDILKIGQNRIKDGLSYEYLKQELIRKGYDLTCDCIEIAIKQWFFDCFHHRGEDDEILKDVKEIDKHSECNFVMKGDSCLKLIERQSSRTNIWIARISMFAALISTGLVIYSILKDQSKQSNKTQIQQLTHSIPTTQQIVPPSFSYTYNYHYYIDSVSSKK